jgi:hypothetical protein
MYGVQSYYAVRFQIAEQFRQESQTKTLCASFLSSSAYLASALLPVRPVELFDDAKLRIIERLYPTWKEKAFLVIHALAGM